MTSPSKNKGDKAERDLVKYLNGAGFVNARRTKAGGEKDYGDVSGVVDRAGELWCLQVADRREFVTSHGTLLAKAATVPGQAEAAGAEWWALVVKRPRSADVGDWFVWLPAWMLLDAALVCDEWAEGRIAVDLSDDGLACVTVAAWVALVAPTLEVVA